ncbi:RNA polymerase sigma factor [Labedaea rhizosphaerae]|uniref:RNA polymerase sigma-70 factor (ECF subfamily) n=1 Tax=Labedaea rhizosphaerae TaxID=598644 RepID=A0A4R6SLB5_LABRH|nr:sigma-70 family RNA polymerase sigma factor [Labedaea rhizosphaerae]TDQ04654.1 RNA polymerase sigma-70 factor (ECF subfamily) [Labedaea rhizosphaerae]
MTTTKPDAAVPTDEPRLALAALFDGHARELHRYLARRLDPASAEDLVAQTFLEAWQHWDRYRPEAGSPRAWLYGIATNLLRRHSRDEERRLRAYGKAGAMAPTDEPADTRADARVDASGQSAALATGLSALRAEERDVLLLVAWAGLTPAEVAEALSLNPPTVRTRLHRARAALRKHIGATAPQEHNHG